MARIEVWIYHDHLTESQSVSIRLNRVSEAIEEAERSFSPGRKLSFSAKFNGRTLSRDSTVPQTTRQNPLLLFEGMHIIIIMHLLGCLIE